MNNWSLYLLENSSSGITYLGVTTDKDRRLKQHNGLLKGGAKFTTARKGNGEWVLKAYIDNLTSSTAHSYESKVKKCKSKGNGDTPLERKINLIKKFMEHSDNLISL